MKNEICFNILKNFIGVFIYLIIVLLITNLFSYLIPRLIVTGWKMYFFVGFFGGIIAAILNFILTSISMLLLYLIDMRFSKYVCLVVTIACLIYSIIIPWQFLSVYGFSFLGIIWGLTFSILFVATYCLFIYYIFHKPWKTKWG